MQYKFGLIGYPIQHSLSPWIHKQFLERTNLQGEYAIIEINPDSNFADEMKMLREKQLNGFNITVPYKEKILDYLDEMDEQASQIGAVNTVLCKNDKWIGYNTDGIGYIRSLLQQFPQLETNKEANILLLGAGGAAKGIYYALMKHGFKFVTIANRTLDKVEKIIDNNPNSKALSLQEAENSLMNFDVIIQTTSVGMKPETDRMIIELNNLREGTIVSDIVYQPLLTKFLRTAKSMNAHIHFGHTMLLYQAQYAFEIWTGVRPEMNELDEKLQKILEG